MELVTNYLIRPFSCFPNFFEISSATSVLFALPFYTLVLIVIHKNRKVSPLDSVFYKLVVCLGVVDVLQMLHMYVVVKFPGAGWFMDAYVFATDVDTWVDLSLYTNVSEAKLAFMAPPSRLFPTYGRCALTFFGGMQYFGVTLSSFNRFTAMCFWNSSWDDRVNSFVYFVLGVVRVCNVLRVPILQWIPAIGAPFEFHPGAGSTLDNLGFDNFTDLVN